MAHSADKQDADKLWAMISGVRFAMMTTQDEDGDLHARPMATLEHAGFADGTLWFFTGADSGKVHELHNDWHVNIAYADPNDQTYVSLAGTGTIVRDRERVRALWRDVLSTWFPKGPDDPAVALIKVTVRSAAYWDAPSGTMVHAYGYVKAKLTGEPPRPGDHGRVSFR